MFRKRRYERERLAASITKLEQWHRIFTQFRDEGYDVAAEMAKGGLSYLSYILNKHYLPVVNKMLDDRIYLTNAYKPAKLHTESPEAMATQEAGPADASRTDQRVGSR